MSTVNRNERRSCERDSGLPRVAAVVGAGTIGTSWATLFAMHEIQVRVYDLTDELLEASRSETARILHFFARHDYLREPALAVQKRIAYTTNIESAAEGAAYVQESCSEDYAVKKEVFARLDRLCAGSVLLASSTSGLLMSEIQRGLDSPQRCVIVHPVNPPHLMPAVEVVPGVQTARESVARACALCRALGRVPIPLKKEVPGYVFNRVGAALWREVIDLVITGVASVEDIDKAVSLGPGLRWAVMGPYLVYHLGGGRGGIKHFMKHLNPAFESWWQSMRTWSSLPEGALETIAAGVEREAKGRSLEDLSEERDELLFKLLQVLQANRD